MRTLGLIGAGNMGGAILRGVVADGYLQASSIVVFDTNLRSKADSLNRDLPGIRFAASAIECVSQSDVVILAVKPNVVRSVINDIRPALKGKAVISIAAGWTVQMLADELEPAGAGYLRVMPNTPAMVGEGMTAICDDSNFTEDDFAFAKGLFESIGRTVVLPERLFDGVIAISGSSPAYVYMMIEAMADAGVKEGLPRAVAYEMSAQAVLGSALMVLTSGTHPAALKDAVCSPGGTTIEAVEELERKGFRAAVMDAMKVCAQKSRDMSK